MPSIKRIKEDVNTWLAILMNSAKTQLEIADAERDRLAISKLYHWLEMSENMRKQAKEKRK